VTGATLDVTQPTFSADYLIVAGGGGGGRGNSSNSYAGGGGGAGGYRTNYTSADGVATPKQSGGGQNVESTLSLNKNTAYSVIIGAGGAAAALPSTKGVVGADSVFANITSIGGGFGAATALTGSENGGNGGSGGGAGYGGSPNFIVGTKGLAVTSPVIHGYDGGIPKISFSNGGGGGGGAGSVGSNGTSDNGANGGIGVNSDISGTTVKRAGGGGGAGSIGGSAFDGGGAGASTAVSGANGTINFGGGGGGGSTNTRTAGSGGSGVIIIKIPDTINATFTGGVTQNSVTSGGFKTITITATTTTSETVTFS
jgi:hypothetical protein